MQHRSKKKRLEINLTNEEMNLLESLSTRFNITKIEVIRQALKVFASKRKHYLTLSFKAIDKEEFTKGKEQAIKRDIEPVSKEEWNKLFEEEKPSVKPEDDLPF